MGKRDCDVFRGSGAAEGERIIADDFQTGRFVKDDGGCRAVAERLVSDGFQRGRKLEAGELGAAGESALPDRLQCGIWTQRDGCEAGAAVKGLFADGLYRSVKLDGDEIFVAGERALRDSDDCIFSVNPVDDDIGLCAGIAENRRLLVFIERISVK